MAQEVEKIESETGMYLHVAAARQSASEPVNHAAGQPANQPTSLPSTSFIDRLMRPPDVVLLLLPWKTLSPVNHGCAAYDCIEVGGSCSRITTAGDADAWRRKCVSRGK